MEVPVCQEQDKCIGAARQCRMERNYYADWKGARKTRCAIIKSVLEAVRFLVCASVG